MSAGLVVNVDEVTGGSELVADVAASATTITVEDPTDFNPEGGDLQLGAEEKSYSAVNEDTGAITLDSALASSHLAEDRVTALPAYVERFAFVQLEGQDETLQARVPHSLYDRLAVGTRDVNLDEGELVELERDPGGELIVADVIDRAPVVGGEFIDPDTLPTPPLTDGLAPATSPVPNVLGGIASLFVQWLPVANPDLVTYEIHVSTSSGFTPGVGTFSGESKGTLFVIRNMPGTANPPAYGTTYFVKLIAKDADGAAAASAEDSATPADGMDDTIIAAFVAANNILAEHLEAVLVMTSTLIAGNEGAAHVRLGLPTPADTSGLIGIEATGTDGTTITFYVDASTGKVYMKGNVDWGTDSALLSENIIELQGVTEGFVTPTLVQADAASGFLDSSGQIPVPVATRVGNTLLAYVLVLDPDGTPPTPTPPAGWSSIIDQTFSSGATAARLVVWKRENSVKVAAPGPTFALGDTGLTWHAHFLEFAGAGVVDVVVATAGSGNPALTGTTAAIAQPGVAVAGFGWIDGSIYTPALNGDGYEKATGQLAGNVIGGGALYGATYFKPVTSGAQATSQGLPGSRPNVGALVVVKAKTGVDTPQADKLRAYAKDYGGLSILTTKNEAGVESIVPFAALAPPLDIPFAKNTSTTVERTHTETANNLPGLGGPVIPNVAGARFRIRWSGVYDHDNAGGTLTLALKAGSTVLDSRNVTQPGSDQSNQGFDLLAEFFVRTIGATANLRGVYSCHAAGAGVPALARGFGVTVDLTAAPRIDVTAQFGGSNVNNAVTTHYLAIDRLG